MKNQTTSLARLLLTRFRWMDESLLKSLKSQGRPELSRAQSMVMSQLGSDEVRISEIARQIGISRQAAQKTVASLELAGLVESTVDPENSSAKLVKLTSTGRQNTEAAERIFASLEEVLSNRIGPDEAVALRKSLEADWGNSVDLSSKPRECRPKIQACAAIPRYRCFGA